MVRRSCRKEISMAGPGSVQRPRVQECCKTSRDDSDPRVDQSTETAVNFELQKGQLAILKSIAKYPAFFFK